MLNYAIDPILLKPFVPLGTELDFYDGATYVSVVGFLFLNTRVLGMPIPLHRNFEEVNLRFYVRRKAEEGWRRGVVFIREFVPRWAIAYAARTFYGEAYRSLPMRHSVEFHNDAAQIHYAWRHGGRWQSMRMTTTGESQETRKDSPEEFITEHYWGYARQRDGRTVEYKVEHPKWRVWPARSAVLDCDVEGLYGSSFVDCLKQSPTSAFLADGSAVTVFRGIRLL
jgi:uncharacterized protein